MVDVFKMMMTKTKCSVSKCKCRGVNQGKQLSLLGRHQTTFKLHLTCSVASLGFLAPLASGILQPDSSAVIIDTVHFHAALAFPLTTSKAMFRCSALLLYCCGRVENKTWLETQSRGAVGPNRNCMKGEYK